MIIVAHRKAGSISDPFEVYNYKVLQFFILLSLSKKLMLNKVSKGKEARQYYCESESNLGIYQICLVRPSFSKEQEGIS